MICSENFTEEDNIVICPECGTPYHRECYQKEKSCVNTELHKSGGAWEPSCGVGSSEIPDVVCPFCGHINPPMSLFCCKCGMPAADIHRSGFNVQFYNGTNINDDPAAYNGNANGGLPFNPFLINFSDPLCGYNPDEDVEGVKMSELGDFIGTNTHYYLPIFKRFKETGRRFSWNFSAMLFPELYFSYRKMPLAAVFAMIARAALNLPQTIFAFSQLGGFGVLSQLSSRFDVDGSAFQWLIMLCTMLLYTLMFTAGLYGNRLYYVSALRKIKKIKARSDGDDIRYILVKKGGTSALLLVLFICLVMLPPLILMALRTHVLL